MDKNIKSPIGTSLNCKGWHQEAAFRMIQNNLDKDVAENPSELIVYGGLGKAARNWDCYKDILESLKNLENDETLLVQSGKPVAIFKTHSYSPRVLISNSMLVPNWANWECFRELDKQGLMMYGQMTAGSWIYIGSQGILQGTYETLAEIARRHFNGSLKGTLTLTAGLMLDSACNSASLAQAVQRTGVGERCRYQAQSWPPRRRKARSEKPQLCRHLLRA